MVIFETESQSRYSVERRGDTKVMTRIGEPTNGEPGNRVMETFEVCESGLCWPLVMPEVGMPWYAFIKTDHGIKQFHTSPVTEIIVL